MKQLILFVGLAGTLLIFQGCSNVPIFPENGSRELNSQSEFGVLVAQPDTYRGQAVKLAGRMVGIEQTEEGTLIMAEWLPFPKKTQYGPIGLHGVEYPRFTLLYPGKLDSISTRHGNKFIVAGQIDGNRDYISLEGQTNSIPNVKARCLHVWKTGDSEFSSNAPDIEQTGFPPLEQTYCS